METIREIAKKALAKRMELKIKVRQPLASLKIPYFKLCNERELLELLKEEINVKNITFGKNFKLDTKITKELEEEGILRDIIRHIQEMRKILKLKPKDKIVVKYEGDREIVKI